MECKKAVGNKLLEKAMSKHWVSLLLPFEVQVVVPGTPLCPCCSAGIRALCSVCSAWAHTTLSTGSCLLPFCSRVNPGRIFPS